eukprot:TRINITY_DN58233_c0_g1_i1.p1 TRINITY_DN58233_c0_g1~~TRINITY_DN58233_c0_g1_i1.p1  ORF type:complete len:783 (-),score=107.25 TRINITY_DN58233_c0_g1_i1:202-2472(-)
MGRTDKKGILGYIRDGFEAVVALDNSNIYAVMLSEMISNIFKEGMWFKALTPYMLIITDNDPVAVGNMLTLNGLTRAFVGVVSGRIMINNLGVDVVWIVSGFLGFLGIAVNVVCLCNGTLWSAYVLNFVWAVYNGLWNSCLETTWARSILKPKREDVNGARQITNKITTSLGPLFSAAIFLSCGNSWDLGLVQNVMLLGTGMTAFTVLLCFCFRSTQEIYQDMRLTDVESIVFHVPCPGMPDQIKSVTIACEELTHKGFDPFCKGGCVLVTYPLGGKSDTWQSQMRVVTEDFQQTRFILVKQFVAGFCGVPAEERTCILHFSDLSRPPLRVKLEALQVYLHQPSAGALDDTNAEDDEDAKVNLSVSRLQFHLNPSLDSAPKHFSAVRVLRGLVLGSQMTFEDDQADNAQDPKQRGLLRQKSFAVKENVLPGKNVTTMMEDTSQKTYSPNILGANVIVVCDVLNALGAGFSLKFMDLFLKVEYGVSPATIFFVAFAQNIFGAWLTPIAKKLLVKMKRNGYRAKLGVVFLWSCSLCFLALICIPAMPIWVVIPSIILTQSLNSCTRAFNRAQLVNFLPREKIATYMTWDALNKANQGGVAIFGAQVVSRAGYRGCFAGTFIILLIRTLIYLGFTLRKGTVYKGSHLRRMGTQDVQYQDDNIDEDMNCVENIIQGPNDEQESQMFQPAEALAIAASEGKKGKRNNESVISISPPEFLASEELPGGSLPISRRASKHASHSSAALEKLPVPDFGLPAGQA